LESLRVGSVVGFDLYVAREVAEGSGGEKFVLYRKRDLAMEEEHVRRLMDSGVEALFVKAEDRKNYRRYLEINLHQILTDEKTELSRKVEIVYEAAAGLIEDVWRNPTSPDSVHRAVALVNDAFVCAVKQKHSIKYLLSAMSKSYTVYAHSVNVCLCVLALAKELGTGIDVVENLGLAALLHDVGKINVDKGILEKRGPLTPEERHIFEQHPQYGVSILEKGAPLADGVYRVVLEHHERCDGSGYPQGLVRDQIHPDAKICGLVDVFDTLTSDRGGKRGVTAYEALRTMRDEMAGCFEADLWGRFATLLAVEE